MKTLAQLGRFGVVGVVLNLALYLLYLILTGAGLAPLVASTMAFVVGVPLSLAAHQRITFRVNQVSNARKMGFAALYLAAYVTQIGTLWLLYHVAGIPHPLAQAIAIFAAAFCTFFIQKKAIFQA